MSMDRRRFIKLNSVTAAGLSLINLFDITDVFAAASTGNDLVSGFITPPDTEKPWAFWMWLSGNISTVGITKDLEEMKRQGIGGVLIYHISGGGTIKNGIKFLTPEWQAMFKFALAEVKRLKMRASLNFCDGWCSGGSWITPEYACKKLIYNEYYTEGGKKITRELKTAELVDNYYKDIAVLAYKIPAGTPLRPARVSASSASYGYVWEVNHPPYNVGDGDPETYWEASSPAPAWVDLHYNDPLKATGAYIVSTAENGPEECELQVIEGWIPKTICKFKLEKGSTKLVSFPEITSGTFRLNILSAYGKPVQVANIDILRASDKPAVKPGIKWWDLKSGKRSFWDWPKQGPIALHDEYTDKDNSPHFRANEVLDISQYMDATGNLTWDAPAGNWVIARYGYTLLGQKMRTSEGGYEADVLSAEAMKVHFNNIAPAVLPIIKEIGGDIFDCFNIDSYEIGADVRGFQPTWSDGFREEFKKRRGYDMVGFMPALSNRIVTSRDVTERFLWDVRRTIGDLFAERFWKTFADMSHTKGIKIQAETGYGTYPYPHIDGLQCAGLCDVPMGEFWYNQDVMSQFDSWGHVNRTVATAGHIYGRKIIATEAFTSYDHWTPPSALKAVGDEAFVAGINRMVLQNFTHQPIEGIKPGFQFGAGTHFDRNITWWEQSSAFFAYLGRCQHLLQAGLFMADVVYYYGESATSFVPGKQYLNPPLPAGYNYDTINTEVLMQRVSVRNNRLVLPDGISYRLLILRADAVMTATTVKKLTELVAAGATVIGARPGKAPGLTNYPTGDIELNKAVQKLWGNCDGKKIKEHAYGKGRVICGKTPAEVMASKNVPQDFDYTGGSKNTYIDFLHRTT
ncbi:MAG: glycosyl hydrolase, partial [Mucilaginibacter sp.]